MFVVVPRRGLEPLRDCSHQLLRLARLPISPPRQWSYDDRFNKECHFWGGAPRPVVSGACGELGRTIEPASERVSLPLGRGEGLITGFCRRF